MGLRGLGMDARACSLACACLRQGHKHRLVVARRDIAGARHWVRTLAGQDRSAHPGAITNSRAQCASRGARCLHLDRRKLAGACRLACAMALGGVAIDATRGPRAGTLARYPPATNQSAVANSRAQCTASGARRFGLDRRDLTHARHHATAAASRCVEMDSRRGSHHDARVAQGNAAGIGMDRGQYADRHGRIAAQCFRRRRLVGRKCESCEPRLPRRGHGELLLGRSQCQESSRVASGMPRRRPTPTIVPWWSGAVPPLPASSQSARGSPRSAPRSFALRPISSNADRASP